MPGSLSGQDIAKGILRRNFKRLPLFLWGTGTPTAATIVQSLIVNNLSKNLSCFVNVGAVKPGANADFGVTRGYLATPGTLQITPITNGDGNDQYVWGNPVFTSPNFTGPLTIPNGWEFATSAPIVQVDVSVDTTKWAAANAGDLIVMDFAVEFSGAWWDPTAIAEMLNRVSLQGPNQLSVIGSL